MKKPWSLSGSFANILIATGGMFLFGSQSIQACQADFSYAVMGGEVFFVNNSTGSTSNTVFTWNLDELEKATVNTTTRKFIKPGTYTVCLTMDDPNGCHSTQCKQITVRSTCTAVFDFVKDPASNKYTFHNYSQGTLASTSYTWDFGDGSTSNEKDPTHIYRSSGNYQVCLTVTDATYSCQSNSCSTVNFHKKVNSFNVVKSESNAAPKE